MRLRPSLLLVAGAALSACFTPTGRWRTVTLDRIATLGAPRGPGSFASAPQVSPPLPGGRWVAWTGGSADTAFVFDSTGRYLWPLAPVGDAAGQLRGVQLVVRGAGDVVLVVSSGRVSVFDRDLKWIRSFPIPLTSVNSAAELDNGWLALASGALTPGQGTMLVDRAGKIVGTLASRDTGEVERRYVQAGVANAVWTARAVGKLEVDRWDSGGLRSELIPLSREWWSEYSMKAAPTAGRLPLPYLSGFWLTEPDQLWLVATVADKGGPAAGLIEASDLKHGLILARTQFDEPFASVVAPGFVARPRHADSGWVVDVYRVGMK